ncbi:hypothetical protein A2U01_0086866, partial [Trifolium medium]|nr:hypothetical protein [Trifolium medium]
CGVSCPHLKQGRSVPAQEENREFEKQNTERVQGGRLKRI